MGKPKLLYDIEAGVFIAHDRSGDGRCLTLQQAHPLGGLLPDELIYVNRNEAERLRDVLAAWLEETK